MEEGSLVFKNVINNTDFVLFNPLNIELTAEPPIFHEIKLKEEDDFWTDIKSSVWSSNCRFFFVVNKKFIIIGNTHNDEAFLCNLSMQVFEEFFNAFGGRCKRMFKKKNYRAVICYRN